MSTIASLVVNLSGNTRPLKKDLAGARASVASFASGMNGVGGMVRSAMATALGPIGLAVGGIAGIAKSISAATESAQSLAKLEAVLASTGGTVGLTSKELQGMAADLQKVTNFEDDATISSMAERMDKHLEQVADNTGADDDVDSWSIP